MKHIFFKGISYTARELAEVEGVTSRTILRRLARGYYAEYDPAVHTQVGPMDYQDEQQDNGRWRFRVHGQWLSSRQLADRLEVSVRTIHRWRTAGTLQAHFRHERIFEAAYTNYTLGRFQSWRFEYEPPPGQELDMNQFLEQIQLEMTQAEATMNPVATRILVKFIDEHGDAIFRTLHFTTFENMRNQIAQLTRGDPTIGSDSLPANIEFSTDTFIINLLRPPKKGGASARHRKKRSNEYFKLLYTYYPRDKGNNCLLHILKEALGLDNVKENRCVNLRKKFGLKPGAMITLDDLTMIEEHLDINIHVYSINDIHIRSNHLGDKTHHVDVVLDGKEQHFYHVIERHMKFEEDVPLKTKDTPRKNFTNLFFDIETVCDLKKASMLIPYAVGWKYHDKYKGCWIYKKQFGLEICIKKFIKWILNNEDKLGPFRITGYNSSRFDNFVLAEYAHKHYEVLTVPIFANNTIYRAVIGKSYTWDLCQFTKCSLKQACKSFNTRTSKIDGFDHSVPQLAYDQGKFPQWMNENEDKLDNYLYNDVESLCNLFYIVQKSINKLTGKHMTSYLTLAHMGYELFKDKVSFEHKVNEEQDLFFRESMIGGRTQSFIGRKKITSKHSFKFGDVNSLYPSVMLDNIFPIGGFVKVDKEASGKLGIYKCVINQETAKNFDDEVVGKLSFPCVIPKREKGENLDWSYRGDMDVTLTSVDIDCVRRAGYKVIVKDGIIFEKTSDSLFEKYMLPFKIEKLRQDSVKSTSSYNAGIRTMCKLFMNSLSGKLLQRNYKYNQQMVKSEFQANKFLDKVDNSTVEFHTMGGKLLYLKAENLFPSGKTKPVFIGTFIYSYARSLMFDKILSKYPVYYMDTDSALVNSSVYEGMKALIGSEFGELSDDVGEDFDTVYIIAPKSYGLFNSGERVKFRCKGVRTTDEYDNIEGIRVEIGDVEFFERLIAGETISVYGNQLRRGLKIIEDSDGYLHIKFRLTSALVVKEIS